MKPWLGMVLRPLCFLFFLAFSSFMISKIYLIANKIEIMVITQAEETRRKSISEIESTAKLLIPLNSSALNLARDLGSSLEGTELDFEAIQNKIAPTLFVALSTIPHVSQVAYIGSDGRFFSFYNNEDQTFAVFSNSSDSPAIYTQPVNRDNGKLYGEANSINSTILVGNKTMFQEALKERKVISALLDIDWSEGKKLFVYWVGVDGRGMISMGFPSKVASDYFKEIDFRGGFFHLASKDGKVIMESNFTPSENYQIMVNNGSVSMMKKVNGIFGKEKSLKCESSHSDPQKFIAENGVYCSSIVVAGIPSVYVLGFPEKDFDSVVHKYSMIARSLVVTESVILFVSLCIFIFFILKLAKREMFLCAALIKQMEATQQAERKSMNKSSAFAMASHDIRASLASITCLIELIQEKTPPESDLTKNLDDMNISAQHLLGILNTVLDTSKIEAGKMKLEEEEFNLAQVIEESVSMYYPIGMKNGVDVIFDTCDGSIFTSYNVKGDRLKCKSILSNLLSNAFTSEGHIIIRAMVKKPSIESEIFSSSRYGVLKILSKIIFCKSFKDLDEIQTVGQKPGDVEFVIEVDDTGRGIPKEKYKSVFENFVQVEETALGQGGSGLGLGIVQSLVRLMGGEIKIVDKERGQKGTCFKFNIFFTAVRSESNFAQEQSHHQKSDDCLWFDFLQQPQIRSPPHKPDLSHVVLVMANKERGKISKNVIEYLGIKVSLLNKEKHLHKLLGDLTSSSDDKELCYLTKSDSSKSNSGSAKSYDIHGKKTSSKILMSNSVLFLIDSCVASSPLPTSALINLKKRLPMCKIVLLENLITRSKNSKYDKENPFEQIVTRPFHGSCLYQVLRLLPEFGGVYRSNSQILEKKEKRNVLPSFEILLEEIVTHKIEEKETEKPLVAKKALVVDDDRVLRTMTKRKLEILGSKVHECVNGRDAYEHVCRVLGELSVKRNFRALPYDYIFMDCQMNVMDGYEATKRIRMEEKQYNIYIPIIALSSHDKTSEGGESRSKHAGMDHFLEKPMKCEKLVEAIRFVDSMNAQT